MRVGDDACAAVPYEGRYTTDYVSGWTGPAVADGYIYWGGQWFAHCKNVNTDGKCPKYKQREVTVKAPPTKHWWKLW